jgi:glutaminase
METNQHNQALAMLMNSYRSFYGDPQEAVEIYTRQCSWISPLSSSPKWGRTRQ